MSYSSRSANRVEELPRGSRYARFFRFLLKYKSSLLVLIVSAVGISLFGHLLNDSSSIDSDQINNNSTPLTQFSIKLFSQMATGKDGNFFISPLSISIALSMCQLAARGETAQQLKKLLCIDHLSGDQDLLDMMHDYMTSLNNELNPNIKLNIANKMYLHHNFKIKRELIDLLSKYFGSQVETVDFYDSQTSADTINSWVAKKTGQKITSLINESDLDDLTRLVLVNAIYFKSDWKIKFKTEHTTKETFYMSSDSTKQVDMMKLFGVKLNYLYSPGSLPVRVLQLPYAGESILMTIILPDEGTCLEEIERSITPDILNEILNGSFNTVTVNLQLPKFKLAYKQELSAHLKALGAVLPFETEADFSGASSGLYISRVIHQAVVEVNEEGTEAVAATVVKMKVKRSLESAPLEFICNRPFFFLIHDKLKHSILFLGRFANT